MSEKIKAIVAEENDGKISGRLKEIPLSDLGTHGVLIEVACSTVNYKDGLAVTGKGRICRRTPLVCGIDLAGTVLESDDPRWKVGDRVLANGYGLSEDHHGGYAQKQRVKGEFLVPVPAAFSFQDAMTIGTAGYTAMLSVHALQDHGLRPAHGPVLVTGAAGGVGSVAILLLAALGYEVTAVTGRPETADYLRSLGASAVIGREELAREAKPLEKERWAGAVDSVGATTLATVLAQTRQEGLVAACGLAGGVGLPSSVMPFILRGVTLRGIDSVQCAMPRRVRAWHDLSRLLSPAVLARTAVTAPLAEVPALAAAILEGKVRGRVVIDVNA